MFEMLPEHKQMLKMNRLSLLEEINPEPVIPRLSSPGGDACFSH